MLTPPNHRSASHRIGATLVSALVVLVVLAPGSVLAVVPHATVTTLASASISIDTADPAASPAGNGSYTTLTGPVITEGTQGDITPGGNVILTIPAGWQLSSSAVSVSKSTAPTGTGCPLTVPATATLDTTARTITAALGGVASSSTELCRLSFSGIRVRPADTTLPNVVDIGISYSGSAGINGSLPTMGTLTAVKGAPVLTFTTQPSSTAVSATAFAPQPTVHVQDQFGNARVADSVVLSIKAGTGTTGAVLSCTSTTVATNGSGDATFAACLIDKSGTGYRLHATDTTSVGTGTADSTTISITPGAPSKFGFVVQPGRGTPGTSFIQQPSVAIQDAQGNTVTTASTSSVTLAIGTNPGAGTLTCTANGIPTSSGVATFSGCRINNLGVGYTLTASGSLTTGTSAAFDVVDRLVFSALPAGAVGGVAFTTQPVVVVKSGTTNVATNDSLTQVTLSISGGTVGAVLSCTTNPVTVSAGYATFAGCAIDKIGTYTVTASAAGLTSASTTLAVTAGPATKLAFTTQPSTSVVAQLLTPQPVVAITDAGGNTVTTGSAASAYVTLAIGTNPGGGTLTCTGGLSKTAVAGVATFSGCSIDRAGTGYTLTASSAGLTSATTAAFNVTMPAAVITITTSSSVITWASGIVLTVQFGANGAGKTFQLQATRDGVTWGTIATLTTDAYGRATLAYRPATNNWYRAAFAGTPDLSAANSPTVRTVVRQIALLRPTNSGAIKSIARNTSITFTTTVRPARPELAPAKVSFSFYRMVSGSWVLIAKRDVYIDAFGLARTTFKFSSSGQWYVRAAANPTPYNANSMPSPRERYNVY